jgi:cold shock CspA family protein
MGRSNGQKFSKQTTYSGICIMSRVDAQSASGFGFIEPAGSDGERSKNVLFGSKACQGIQVNRGDEVRYILNKKPRPEGPSAYRVWLHKRAVETDDEREITTLHGELEV